MRKLFAMSALAATLFAQPEAPECIPMDDFAATLRPVRLRGVDLYEPDGLAKAGSILELDLAAQPTVVRLRGAAPANLGSYCVRREDVERQIAYQPSLIRHEMDGIACVSFDEGRPHSALFQRLEHNRGAELRLYPFALSQGEWRRLDARGGFAREAFRFECGVQVGDATLLRLMEDAVLRGARAVVRADSPLAADPAFEKAAEFQWNGVTYWAGRGLGLPAAEDGRD